MKKSYVLLLLLVIFSTSATAKNSIISFDEAKKIALESNKLVFVDFWTQDCRPNSTVDINTFSFEELKFIDNNFVVFTVDYDALNSLYKKYDLKKYPVVFIVDGNGVVVCNESRVMNNAQLLNLIRKYTFDLSKFTQDLKNFNEKSNFSTAFRLGTKYQNYSMIVDKQIRKNIYKTSISYFAEAKKFLQNSNLKNKDGFKQKLELLEIQDRLIANRPKKALKLLKKYELKDIQQMNKKLFSILKYTTYLKIKDTEYARDWSADLSEVDKKRAEKFLEMS